MLGTLDSILKDAFMLRWLTRPSTSTATAPASQTPDEVKRVTAQYGERNFAEGWFTSLRRLPVKRLEERALRRATDVGDRAAVDVLLDYGVDVLAPSHGNIHDNAFTRAAWVAKRDPGPLAAMLAHRAKQLVTGGMAFDINAQIPVQNLEQLRDLGDFKHQQPEGNTALHEAVRAESLEAVNMLVATPGIGPSLIASNALAQTPLAIARKMTEVPNASRERHAILEALVDALQALEAVQPPPAYAPATSPWATPQTAPTDGITVAGPRPGIDPSLPPAYQWT